MEKKLLRSSFLVTIVCLLMAVMCFSLTSKASFSANMSNLTLVNAALDSNDSEIRESLWHKLITSQSLDVDTSGASDLDFSSHYARTQGRMLLASGQITEAANFLSPQTVLAQESVDPFLLVDAMIAQSLAGNDASVLVLAREFSIVKHPETNDVVNRIVALALVRQAHKQIGSGNIQTAEPLLEQTAQLRPFDLYTNYWLWQILSARGQNASDHLVQLTRYPLESVNPQTEKQFLELFFTVLPELIERDIWDIERGENMLAYWIWQSPTWSALDDVLEQLVARFPDEEVWLKLQSEYYSRRSAVNTDAVQAFDVSLEKGALENNDLSGRSNIGLRAGHLLDESSLANILGVSANAIEIGADLFEPITPSGDNFSLVSEIEGWPFVVGVDHFQDKSSLRISNLWWTAERELLNFTPYAELWSNNVPLDSEWIVAEVDFKTLGDADRFGYWGIVNADSENWQPYLALSALPETSGQWHKAIIVALVPDRDRRWFTVLRNWGAANTWFSKPAIRQLTIDGELNQCLAAPCVIFQAING